MSLFTSDSHAVTRTRRATRPDHPVIEASRFYVVPKQKQAEQLGGQPWDGLEVAAIIPCHNEAGAIAKVVHDLQREVPGITVYVYDNASTDGTAEVAREAGAMVRHVVQKGKGNVVRRAFADIDADVYLMVDGDDTYDVAAAPELLRTLVEGHYDHVLGVREELSEGAYRPNHALGNQVLNRVVGMIFGTNVGDMLSGYRAFSRRFVKSFPAASREFEIETELTVHTLSLRAPSMSVPVGFRERAEGTESKLRTYRDGGKILHLISSLTRHERPMAFYGLIAAVTTVASLALGVPVLSEYLATGMVPRMPSLVTALGFGLVSGLALTCGLILDGMRKTRHELSRLMYLQHEPPKQP